MKSKQGFFWNSISFKNTHFFQDTSHPPSTQNKEQKVKNIISDFYLGKQFQRYSWPWASHTDLFNWVQDGLTFTDLTGGRRATFIKGDSSTRIFFWILRKFYFANHLKTTASEIWRKFEVSLNSDENNICARTLGAGWRPVTFLASLKRDSRKDAFSDIQCLIHFIST